MVTTEKFTRIKRPSIFEIPIWYRDQQKKSKSPCVSFLSKFSFLLVPIGFIIRVVGTIILTPVVTVVYLSLAIFVALPCHLFRKVLSWSAHVFDEDLAKLVSSSGVIPSRDYADWDTAPSQSITIVIKLKGHCDSIDIVRNLVLERLIERRDKNNVLEYPEMQQYVTKRFGYLFFKWDREFKISNHVREFHSPDLLPDPINTVADEERITSIWENVARRAYPRKRSAWDMLLIPNYNSEKMTIEDFRKLSFGEKRSVLLIRFHHGYTDGLSIYRFLMAMTDHGLDIWEKEVAKFRMTKWLNITMNLTGLIGGPFALAKQLARGPDAWNMLHPPWSQLNGKYHIIRCTMPLETVKNGRRAHNDVSLHSVIMAGIAGGIRSYFLKYGKGIPFLPVKLGLPVPRPGHSSKLRNDYLSSFITLPIEKSTGKKRILACEKRLRELMSGAITPFLTQAVNLIGGFPVQCVRYITKKSDYTVLYSVMRGPDIPLKIQRDYELEDLYYSFGLGVDDLAVGFSSISYNGNIHLMLTVDQGVCKDRMKAEELMTLIEKEIEALQYGDCTNL